MASAKLQGFEDALGSWIAANFRFDDPNKALALGAHVFVQDMPEVEALEQRSQPEWENGDPTVAIFTEAAPPLGSPRGAKLEWTLRFVLRYGVVPEGAKERLEELFEKLLTMIGVRVGKFQVKAALGVTRPAVFVRVDDEHAFAAATVHFKAVATPT